MLINELLQEEDLRYSSFETRQFYLESIKSRIEEDGYYSSANTSATCADSTNFAVAKLKRAVTSLVCHGYPATFVLLLDECWEAVEQMEELMSASTGNSVCNMDILAWMIDPKQGSGFSPHRDRQVSNSHYEHSHFPFPLETFLLPIEPRHKIVATIIHVLV